MTGSVVRSPAIPVQAGPPVRRVELKWTADGSAGGAAVDDAVNLNGTLIGAAFVPNVDSSQPTDLYDVTLLDADAIDILGGAGANLSQSTATRAFPTVGSTGLPFALAGLCTLHVANAGPGKAGKVVLYLR